MKRHIPTFTMRLGTTDIFEKPVAEEDLFYERLLDFIQSNLKSNYRERVLCYLEDPEGNLSEATLEEEGYYKSLNKCIEYFREEEQYEKCTYIKKLIEKYGLQ